MTELMLHGKRDDPAFHHSESSQDARILEYLKAGNSLTPLEALELFGTMRLSGRILDLRREGHAIKTDIVEANGKRFASYRL